MKKAKPILTIILLVVCAFGMHAQALNRVDDVIEQVRKDRAPDKRQTVFDVKAVEQDGKIVLQGTVSDPDNLAELERRIRELGGADVSNDIILLPQDKWALIKIPVACMRTKGSYSAELATQGLMGMPVRVYDEEDGWWRIQTPDGYLGWVWRASLQPVTAEELARWKQTSRLVVTTHHQIEAYDSPEASAPRNTVTDLVPGNIVEGNLGNPVNGRIEISLPDGRKAWADESAFTPIEKWADQPFDADVILDQAYSLMGAPYLWGGTSAKMTDCSGLVKVSYLANGRILRRDASQQIFTGTRIEPEDIDSLQPGDLIFFGSKPGGRATHVGIYDNDKWFIHCAGRVHRSRMVQEDPSFGGRAYLGGTRIAGNDGTTGIEKVINHPWYF